MFERYIETEDFVKLPISGKGYWVNTENIIRDSDNCILKIELDNVQEYVVYLNWYDGKRFYKLAEVLAHTFKPIRIPVKLWGRLTVLYKDNNCKNLHPSNLVWKFPIKLECKAYKDFYYIPCFSRFVINSKGVIIEFTSGRVVKLFNTTNTYVKALIKPDIGPVTVYALHRLLAFVFIDYKSNVDVLHVNHLDGMPSNNSLENLELVTAKENAKHASRTGLHATGKGRLKLNIPVKMRNVLTGEENTFLNVSACSIYTGLSQTSIYKRLYDINQPVCKNNFQFKRADFNTEWLSIADASVYTNNNDTDQTILVKNISTNIVTEFTDVYTCAIYLNLSINTLKALLVRKDQPMSSEFNIVKYKHDLNDWRIINDINLELAESVWNKKVLLKDLTTGIVHSFDTQRLCSNFLNICESVLYNRLIEPGQRILKDKYQVKYEYDKTPWREIIDLELETADTLVNRHVLTRNAITKEIHDYVSLKQCADANNILITTLHWRLQNGDQRVFPEGFQYKYKSDPRPWINIEELNPVISKIKVLVEFLESDTIKEYPSIKACGRDLNLHKVTVKRLLNKEEPYRNMKFKTVSILN